MNAIKELLAANARDARYDARRMSKKFKMYVADVVYVKYPRKKQPIKGYMVDDQILFEDGHVLDDAREHLKKHRRYKKDLKRPGDWSVGASGVEILVSDRGDVMEI